MDELLNGLDIFPCHIIILRLFAAFLAGFLIGLEREKNNQPAGLRTHMVLALGASLIMLLSIYIPLSFAKQGSAADPGRMAAQVISGIGFLGAGAIFRYGFNVKGLTTAASIWTTSGIGLAFGAGFYFLGAVSTAFLILILASFGKVENFLIERSKMRVLTVIFDSTLLTAKRVIGIVKEFGIYNNQPSILENVENGTMEIVFNCRIEEEFSLRELFESIKAPGGIKSVRVD